MFSSFFSGAQMWKTARRSPLREIIRIHVEDDGDVFGEGGFFEDGLDVVGEGAGFGGAEGDLEAELLVGADELR